MFTGSDSFVDLSLRILTGVILVVLLVALALLIWHVARPRAPAQAPIPLVDVAPKPAPAAAPAVPEAPPKPQVLHDPGKVYRCVVAGRTTFSERPCPQATETAPPKR
jgi:hypothetical protein